MFLEKVMVGVLGKKGGGRFLVGKDGAFWKKRWWSFLGKGMVGGEGEGSNCGGGGAWMHLDPP